jgi:hypothetical protein
MKQQNKPQMLINSRSPIKIIKSYESYEINIINPREYGGVGSSNQNSTVFPMLRSPDKNESSLSRFNSVAEEDIQFQKHLLSQKKIKNKEDSSQENNKQQDLKEKTTISNAMKQGFRNLRKIAKELKVYKSGDSTKRKTNDKREPRKKRQSLFKANHNGVNDLINEHNDKLKQKTYSNKNLNCFNVNDKILSENKFMYIKSKTSKPSSHVNDSPNDNDNKNTSLNDNNSNFILSKRDKKFKTNINNIFALQYKPYQDSDLENLQKQNCNKFSFKSPMSYDIDENIITLKDCSPSP